jgi:hypothetical protein
LSVYAVAQKTIIDGRVYFDRERDIASRAEVAKEKKALIDKQKAAEKKADAKPGDKKPDKFPDKNPAQKKPEETKPEKPSPPMSFFAAPVYSKDNSVPSGIGR